MTINIFITFEHLNYRELGNLSVTNATVFARAYTHIIMCKGFHTMLLM